MQSYSYILNGVVRRLTAKPGTVCAVIAVLPGCGKEKRFLTVSTHSRIDLADASIRKHRGEYNKMHIVNLGIDRNVQRANDLIDNTINWVLNVGFGEPTPHVLNRLDRAIGQLTEARGFMEAARDGRCQHSWLDITSHGDTCTRETCEFCGKSRTHPEKTA